jgi:hypothetical protein
MSIDPQIRVPWRALEGSQEDFFNYTADHLLYTGTRGPGKTDAQLMRFKKRVGQGYGPFWRGVIFDREYKNLDDIISKSKRWFPLFADGAKFLESSGALKWVWPTGEELMFRHAAKPSDYWKYHGQEFPFIGWNELCSWASENLYEGMMSCNRSSYTPEKDGFIGGVRDKSGTLVGRRPDGSIGVPPPIPLEVCSTTNSYGPGHNWVKRRFITPASFGEPVLTSTKVFDPGTRQDVVVVKKQVAFFGSYRENKYLSPSYIAEIKKIKDTNKRKAWLGGSWDIVAGGALDDVWNRATHVLERFVPPISWHIDRALDWGSTHPASVGWFAEANGEEAELADGTRWCPPKGTLIQLDELYVTESIGSNVGLKWSSTRLAEAIVEREKLLMSSGRILKQPRGGPADNQIRDVRESDVDTIEKKMADVGIRWERSDKSPGSRRVGLELIRERLEAATSYPEKPALYFMENCKASIDLLPTLPRDPDNQDDVDTSAEDHPYDMLRYRVLKGNNRFATQLAVSFAT